MKEYSTLGLQMKALMLPIRGVKPESKLFLIRVVYRYGSTFFDGSTRRLGRDFVMTDLVINRALRELTIAGVLRKVKHHSGGKGRPRNRYQLTAEFIAQPLPQSANGFHSYYKIIDLVCGVDRFLANRLRAAHFKTHIQALIEKKQAVFQFMENRLTHTPIMGEGLLKSWFEFDDVFWGFTAMKFSLRVLLAILISYADGAGVLQGVTIKQLMNLTGMTKKRLMQHMTELVKQEYIRRFVPDYVGAYSPLKDRTGICLLNLCNANFEKAGVAQVGFVALLPPEFPVSAQLDAAAFKELDQSHRQYVGQVLQLYTPKDDHDHDDFLMQDSKLDIDHQVQLFKKMIVKQAQLPAALRLFEQLNEGLVQFLLLKLDQLAFEIIRQRWSNYQFETDYQKFVRRNQGEWTQRLTPDSTELGELIWAVAELKAWRYMQFIASGKHSVFHVCVPSGFTPHEQNRVGFILTTHHHQCGAYFPIRFQQSRPNRQWSTLIDRKEIEQVKRDYGFLTKSGLTDEERRRVYSSFMDG